MASSKRRRTIDDDGDSSDDNDKIIDVETARSELRRTKPKRSRLAKAQENGGSVVSDDEPSSDEAYTDIHPYQQGEGYAGSSDDDMELEQEIRDDYLKRNSSNRENQAADHGVIEEVYCQNFMCHNKLRIKLGPLINFIIGHNGSGKSAVLTALTLCLGVKATATNRGGSLKKFIKEGQESAMLSVKIKNQGSLAYQPELYGDSIVVERHFNKQGASQFKIKSAEDRIITTKRADLEDMLDYLSLQLDNPLNVLTQDLARQFLSSSTPSDKYKFFMKGTQLEQLDRDYRMMHEFIDQSEAKCESREEDISHLKRKMEQAEEMKKRMDSIDSIRERIKKLTWQHAWAQVEEVERELEDLQRKIEQSDEHIERRRQEVQAKSEDYDGKNATVEAARQVKLDLEREAEPIGEEHDKAKEDFDVGKTDVSNNISELRHIKADLKAADDEINKYKAQLAEEERRIEAASGPAQAEKLAELKEAEEELKSCQRAQHEQGGKQELQRVQDSAKDLVTARGKDVEDARDRVAAAEDRLHSLRNDQGNQMRAFHQNMPRLLQAIASETRFRAKPVGPLGLHVKLKKAEWSSIVEQTFGAVLEAFVVTSSHDQSILRGLQQRVSCHGDIYISDSRPIDVSNQRAMTEEDTLLTLLDIDSDLARNQFIINQNAEQTVMIKSRRKAMDLMDGPGRPRNAKVIISMHDHIPHEGHRFQASTSGLRMDRVRPWTKFPRMKTDIDGQIRNQLDAVNAAKRQLEASRVEFGDAESKHKEAREAVNRYDRQKRDLRIATQRSEDKIEQIKNELEGFTIQAGNLDAIKTQLAESEAAKQQHANSYTDAQAEKQGINEVQRERKKRLDAVTARLEEMEAHIKKVEASIVRHEQARQTALREKNLAIGLAEDAEKQKDEYESSRTEVEQKVVEWTGMATQIHARVPIDRGMTTKKIDDLLESMKKQQDNAEAAIGASREEVQAQWAQARHEWREAETGLKQLKTILSRLKNSYLSRKDRWQDFKKHITARARIMFGILLHERGFKGRLTCDHGSRHLDIAVEPDTTQESDKGRQVKTLSGGEKSFSTICLLLAIWEAMGSPIRCLDEFDVFMDNVNRDTSMRMMIQAARRATGKQYVLITPQSMGNVPVKEDMRIHKMSDPERGQTAITF